MGFDNISWEGIKGNEGFSIMNDNGLRFVFFCIENSFVIGGICFKYKDIYICIYEYIWILLYGYDRNQINYAIIRRFRRLLFDINVQRGIDVVSDYYFVRCKIRLKLVRNRKK